MEGGATLMAVEGANVVLAFVDAVIAFASPYKKEARLAQRLTELKKTKFALVQSSPFTREEELVL